MKSECRGEEGGGLLIQTDSETVGGGGGEGMTNSVSEILELRTILFFLLFHWCDGEGLFGNSD